MIILGIETSCDETAAAVLERKNNRITILSNVVASSALLQSKYGGIIPEQAAREQIKSIIPVIEESLQVAGYSGQKIDAIAVTYGPGLIGSLLVGVEAAKTLALVWNKPLIPINHLIGHFYANWICQSAANNQQLTDKKAVDCKLSTVSCPQFPCLGLLVSGGHTDLVLFTDHGKYKYLGGTRDDAAGECFDKCARVLGFSYPGGPKISKLALQGQTKTNFPRPMLDSKNFDFSFSGLKTAFVNMIGQKFKLEKGEFNKKTHSWVQKSLEEQLTPTQLKDMKNICASLEEAIVDVLVEKTIRAAREYNVEQIMVAGGVAANQKLVGSLQVTANSLNPKVQLFVQPPNLCTDNGAMIASAGFFIKKTINPLKLQADPNLSL